MRLVSTLERRVGQSRGCRRQGLFGEAGLEARPSDAPGAPRRREAVRRLRRATDGAGGRPRDRRGGAGADPANPARKASLPGHRHPLVDVLDHLLGRRPAEPSERRRSAGRVPVANRAVAWTLHQRLADEMIGPDGPRWRPFQFAFLCRRSTTTISWSTDCNPGTAAPVRRTFPNPVRPMRPGSCRGRPGRPVQVGPRGP